MDVRLPDGTIVQNVPDGTTQSELMDRLGKAGVSADDNDIIPAPLRAFAGAALDAVPVLGPTLLKAGEELRSLIKGRPVEDVQQETKNLFRENPSATTAGSVAGALIGTAPLAVGGAGAALFGTAARAAATGAGLSAADAIARSNNIGADFSGGGIAIAAGTGAAFGAASPAVGRIAGGLFAKLANGVSSASEPVAQMLKTQASALYRAADEAGVVVGPETLKKIVSGVSGAAKEAGLNAQLHPKAQAVVNFFKSTTEQPNASTTLRELDQFRQILGDVAHSNDAGERRLGAIMIDKFDDALAGLTKADVSAGDPVAANQAITAARALFRRSKIIEALDGAEQAARDSGTAFAPALRAKVRGLLSNKRFTRGLQPDELTALRQVNTAPEDKVLAVLDSLRGIVGGGIGGGGIGGFVGFQFGGPPGAALGAGVGSLAATGVSKAAQAARGALASSRLEAARRVVSGFPELTKPFSKPAAATTLAGGVSLNQPGPADEQSPQSP